MRSDKPRLPPIDAELMPAPRLRVDLKALKLKESLPDKEIEANSQAIGSQWGASTHLPRQPEKPVLTSVRLDLPEYLDRQLGVYCAQNRVTKAYLIMRALAKDGFEVHADDLVPDRRKRGRRV